MLVFHHAALHKIKIHAMRSYPEECCGFLFGRKRQRSKAICDVFGVINQDSNRTQHYLIPPETYKQAEELARHESVEIVGLYHSHPDQPTHPSTFDQEHALPNWSYVVVSVEKGIPTEVCSWVLQDDRSRFLEEEIQDWIDYDSLSTNHPVKRIQA